MGHHHGLLEGRSARLPAALAARQEACFRELGRARALATQKRLVADIRAGRVERAREGVRDGRLAGASQLDRRLRADARESCHLAAPVGRAGHQKAGRGSRRQSALLSSPICARYAGSPKDRACDVVVAPSAGHMGRPARNTAQAARRQLVAMTDVTRRSGDAIATVLRRRVPVAASALPRARWRVPEGAHRDRASEPRRARARDVGQR